MLKNYILCDMSPSYFGGDYVLEGTHAIITSEKLMEMIDLADKYAKRFESQLAVHSYHIEKRDQAYPAIYITEDYSK